MPNVVTYVTAELHNVQTGVAAPLFLGDRDRWHPHPLAGQLQQG